LTRNAGRHDSPNRSAPTITPPSTSPATAPTASTAPNADNARARSAPVKRSWMTLMICGTISAAPAPWTNRSATSAAPVGASPHASDATVKTAAPVRYMARRPSTAPSRAPVISSMA
jgi:hypothetical protein